MNYNHHPKRTNVVIGSRGGIAVRIGHRGAVK